MKRILLVVVSLFVVFGAMPVGAGVNVDVSIGVPPPIQFAAEPDVVVVPSGSAYVYMVPDTPGLYFYNNFWYRFFDGRWFRSSIYNGAWVYIPTRRVPRFVIDVPPDYYLSLPVGYYRIHYGDLHRNWRAWDRGRYWNRYDWYRHEYREHGRRHHDEGRGHHDEGRGHHDGGQMRRDDGHHDGGGGPRHDGGGPRHDGGGKRYDSGGPRHDSGATKRSDANRLAHPDKSDRDR